MTTRSKLVCCLAGALFVAVALALITHPAALGVATMAACGAAVAGTVSFASTSYTPDRLVISLDDVVSRKVTLLSGQNCIRGTVLGRIAVGAVSETHAGNTGNGAMTLDASTPRLANAQVGVYTVKCTAAASNSGTFRVYDPLGNVLGDVAVAATFSDQIKFVIADGATDFIVGDTFLVTVAAGSGKYVKSLSAAIDGSQIPDCILAEDTDASSADVDTPGYFRGQFNDAAITLGTAHTVASIREGLRVKGIDLIAVQAA